MNKINTFVSGREVGDIRLKGRTKFNQFNLIWIAPVQKKKPLMGLTSARHVLERVGQSVLVSNSSPDACRRIFLNKKLTFCLVKFRPTVLLLSESHTSWETLKRFFLFVQCESLFAWVVPAWVEPAWVVPAWVEPAWVEPAWSASIVENISCCRRLVTGFKKLQHD